MSSELWYYFCDWFFCGIWLLPGETMDVFLAEFQRLTLLVGDVLSEKWMTCAFVVELLNHVRQLLWASSRMDDMTWRQILTKAQAIMSDGKESVAAAVQPLQSITDHTSPTSDNHWCVINALDWIILHDTASNQCGEGHSGPICKMQGKLRWYMCQKIGHVVFECLEKQKGARCRCQYLPSQFKRGAPHNWNFD